MAPTKSVRAALAIGAVLVLSGCGSSSESTLSRAAVDGIVMVNGAPLPNGVIRFIPAGGTAGPKTSVAIVSNAFVADKDAGPPVGAHVVEIESIDLTKTMDDEEAVAKLRAEAKSPTKPKPPTVLAAADLSANVTAEGPNHFEFKLTSKPVR